MIKKLIQMSLFLMIGGLFVTTLQTVVAETANLPVVGRLGGEPEKNSVDDQLVIRIPVPQKPEHPSDNNKNDVKARWKLPKLGEHVNHFLYMGVALLGVVMLVMIGRSKLRGGVDGS